MKYLDNKNPSYIEIEGNYYYRYDPTSKQTSSLNFYSTGIVNRPNCLKTLRITLLNTSKCSQNFNFLLHDWTSGDSILIKSTNISLDSNNGKVIDILLEDCSINIEFYEIRITPYSNRLIVNSYNI